MSATVLALIEYVPDETLLSVQAHTLALPVRTDADRQLLDRIGREWQRRKSQCS